MASPKQAPKTDALTLCEYVELHHPELVEQAKAEHKVSEPAESPKKWQRGLKILQGLFLANPDEFHGTAYVTPELKQHSQRVAGIVSVSGLYDFFTNASLFYLSFKSLGIIPGLPLSLLVNQLLLKFGNDSAAVTSGHKPGTKRWARAGVMGLVSVNIIQSLFSVVGMELFLNSTGIAELRASALIEEHEQKIESLRNLSNPRLDQAKQACQEKDQKLNAMTEDDPMRASEYVRTYGLFEDKDKDWSKEPESALPVCPLAERLGRESLQTYDQAKAEWEVKKVKRLEMGNDVTFLRNAVPDLYNFHFDENGEMRSSIDAAAYAALNLLQKLLKGDMAGLGIPLFMWSLSIATSWVACVMTIRHAH